MKVFSFSMTKERPFAASLEATAVEAQVFMVHCPNWDSKDLTTRIFLTTSKEKHLSLGKLGPERLSAVAKALDKAFDSCSSELIFMTEDDAGQEGKWARGILVAREGAGSPILTYVLS